MTESFDDKEMEETNGDSQDSETSSTSSWILLSTDENPDENASRENKEILLTDTETNSVVESRSSQSDIDSDGISIISENEFYQAKNHGSPTAPFEEDKWYGEEEMPKIQEYIDESIPNTAESEETEESEYSTEEIDQIPEESSMNNHGDDFSQTDSQQLSLLNCRCNSDQIFDYSGLLLWPSVFTTTMVILAVFLFPFYSSNVENKKFGDMERDVYAPPDENLDNAGSLIFCREKHKKGSRNSEYYFEKCLEAQSENNRDDIRKKLIPRKHSCASSEYTSLKPLRKDEYYTEEDEMEILVELDESLIETEEVEPIYDLHKFETWKNYEHELLMHQNTDFVKYVSDKLQAQFHKEKEDLSQKEKYLKEWEEKLIERERKIKQHTQKDKNKDNKNKQTKYKIHSTKKQKGDFDYDNSNINKMRLGEKKKIGSFPKYQEKNKNNYASNKCNKRNVKDKERTEPNKEKENSINGKDKTKTFSPKKMFGKFWRNENRKAAKNTDGHARLNLRSQVTVNAEPNYFKVQSPPRKNRTRLDDDNVTLTGEWYLNLVHGRQDIRKKEEKAHWWFDRVEFRRNKRNKAHWYFQYMFNRENLRYRSRNI